MLTLVLRMAMTAAHRSRTLLWRVTRRTPRGVHGVVLTGAGEIVLVRLTYARGWHLPGGGRRRGETSRDGVLRELREEIGLRAWSSLQELGSHDHVVGGVSLRNAVFLVRDARYQPRWSLEIAEVRAFARSGLPPDLSRRARNILAEVSW